MSARLGGGVTAWGGGRKGRSVKNPRGSPMWRWRRPLGFGNLASYVPAAGSDDFGRGSTGIRSQRDVRASSGFAANGPGRSGWALETEDATSAPDAGAQGVRLQHGGRQPTRLVGFSCCPRS